MVVTVVPISVVMLPSPVAWRPSVIGAAYVIARAPSIVRLISNRDRDSAWIGTIARVSGITRSGLTITAVIGAVSRISTIIISASASSESDRKQKE